MRRAILLAVITLLTPAALALAGPQAQIIGGTPVSPSAPWPALTAVIYAGYSAYQGQFCGGTLIAPQRVLTAAHCMVDAGGNTRAPESLTVAPGARVLSEVTAGQQIAVTRVDVHPSYDKDTYANDAAVLHLASSSSAPPALLPAAGETAQTGWATEVAGWGTMATDPTDYPDTAMQVNAPILADSSCASYGGSYVTSVMLCAGTTLGGLDSCWGDSGGPLALGAERTLVGIVSWGNSCALAGYPGVYTRVSAMRSWVTSAAGIVPGAPQAYTRTRIDADTVRVSWDPPVEYAWSIDSYRAWVNGTSTDLSLAAREFDVALSEGTDALIQVAGVSAAGAGTRASVGADPTPAPTPTPATPEPAPVTPVTPTPVTPVAPTLSPPALATSPVVRGRMVVRATLRSTRGTWVGEGVTTRVRFERARAKRGPWRAVAKDGVTYRIRAADRGMYLRARVTATNSAGSAVARTAARRVR